MLTNVIKSKMTVEEFVNKVESWLDEMVFDNGQIRYDSVEIQIQDRKFITGFPYIRFKNSTVETDRIEEYYNKEVVMYEEKYNPFTNKYKILLEVVE